MTYDYDLAIIGAGSAGMAAAEVAAHMRLRVLLVERDRVGGDCLWTGCVPSKTLIASSRVAHQVRCAEAWGIVPSTAPVDSRRVLARVHAVQQNLAATTDSPDRLRALGVDVRFAAAAFADEHTLRLDAGRVTARRVLICTGSRPAVPGIPGLQEAGFLTPGDFFSLDGLPSSLLIVGGGPIAVELAQACARLGADVTVLEQLPTILPREEPLLRARLRDVLEREGVCIVESARVERAHRRGAVRVLTGTADGEPAAWEAEAVLVAAGRRPNVEDLQLDAAGVQTRAAGIVVDDRLRTHATSIYAAGDVAGRFPFTHSAVAEASIALRNMFYPLSKKAPQTVPWATFTDPELTHAGLTSEEARAQFGEGGTLVFRRPLTASDRARADGAQQGELVLISDRSHRLLGAHLLAPGAGEVAGCLGSLVRRRESMTPGLVDAIQAYPTYAFELMALGGEATYQQLESRFLRTVRRLNAAFGI
ncbi:MAG: FAD-dependent oxidoreductase [Dehalococcoidia bacterium]